MNGFHAFTDGRLTLVTGHCSVYLNNPPMRAFFLLNGAVMYLTGCIIDATTENIEKSQGQCNKRRISWWNDECGKAWGNQNKDSGLLCEPPIVINLIRIKHVK